MWCEYVWFGKCNGLWNQNTTKTYAEIDEWLNFFLTYLIVIGWVTVAGYQYLYLSGIIIIHRIWIVSFNYIISMIWLQTSISIADAFELLQSCTKPTINK